MKTSEIPYQSGLLAAGDTIIALVDIGSGVMRLRRVDAQGSEGPAGPAGPEGPAGVDGASGGTIFPPVRVVSCVPSRLDLVGGEIFNWRPSANRYQFQHASGWIFMVRESGSWFLRADFDTIEFDGRMLDNLPDDMPPVGRLSNQAEDVLTLEWGFA